MERRQETIARNLERCRSEIEEAARRAQRDPRDVALLAVTKYVGSDVIRVLHGLGLRDFGESRVQRGVALREELRDLDDIRWHLIGHLQRNKVRTALANFAVIHSLDSERLTDSLLERASPAELPELYVEVNVSEEPAKTGLEADDLPHLLEHLEARGVTSKLRGLMGMSGRTSPPDVTRREFRALRELRDRYVHEGLLPDGAGLSMGMSGDFSIAIEEGATIVRIGSLLFEGLAESEG